MDKLHLLFACSKRSAVPHGCKLKVIQSHAFWCYHADTMSTTAKAITIRQLIAKSKKTCGGGFLWYIDR